MATDIRIPRPCNADWNEMQPADNGRHCALCSKTVTDFTGWETEEIIAYLQAGGSRKICGRITVKQAGQRPANRKKQVKEIWRSAAPVYRRIAAVIVLFFGIGNIAAAQVQKDPTPNTLQAKPAKDPVIMGGIMPVQTRPAAKPKTQTTKAVKTKTAKKGVTPGKGR